MTVSTSTAPTIDTAEFILPHETWSEAVGIKLNGCIDDTSTTLRGHVAHAHSSPRDEWHGWICTARAVPIGTIVPLPADLPSPMFGAILASPNMLMLHEYAHLKAGYGAGHGSEWRHQYDRLIYMYGMTDQVTSAHTLRRGDIVRLTDTARPAMFANRLAMIRETRPTRALLHIEAYEGNTTLWPYDLIELVRRAT